MFQIATGDDIGKLSILNFSCKCKTVLPNLVIHFDNPDSTVHGATWGPSGANRSRVGPMLAPLTLLSGNLCNICKTYPHNKHPTIFDRKLNQFNSSWSIVPYVSWKTVLISLVTRICITNPIPDSKVHGANMGPTWVLLAPDGPHVGPSNLAIRVYLS